MRILHVQTGGGSSGGIANYIANLVRSEALREFEFVVAAGIGESDILNQNKKYSAARVVEVSSTYGLLDLPKMLTDMRRLLRQQNITLVHSHALRAGFICAAMNLLFKVQFVHTNHGRVRANFIVLACNAYLEDLDASLRAKIMPVSNYVIATQPLDADGVARTLPADKAVSDANFVLDYYHLSSDQRLLYGGQVSYDGREPRNLRQRMEAKMTRIFPALEGVRVEHIWGGWVGITLNRFPHFGRLGRNLYFAHGYSGQGMAMGGMAGRLLAEAIGGQAERFDIFARMPHRNFPGGRRLRTPLLVLATNFLKMRDLI